MESKSTVESFMHRVSFHIGVVNIADHMEVNCISAELEGLTYVIQFDVREASSQRVISH